MKMQVQAQLRMTTAYASEYASAVASASEGDKAYKRKGED
jgi:hypothetical protein